VVWALLVLPHVACAKQTPIDQVECFDVSAGDNSEQTRAVFGSRHCQGGGVTWAALLDVLARRRGHVEPIDEVAPGR
jgi:hypothetical protein